MQAAQSRNESRLDRELPSSFRCPICRFARNLNPLPFPLLLFPSLIRYCVSWYWFTMWDSKYEFIMGGGREFDIDLKLWSEIFGVDWALINYLLVCFALNRLPRQLELKAHYLFIRQLLLIRVPMRERYVLLGAGSVSATSSLRISFGLCPRVARRWVAEPLRSVDSGRFAQHRRWCSVILLMTERPAVLYW